MGKVVVLERVETGRKGKKFVRKYSQEQIDRKREHNRELRRKAWAENAEVERQKLADWRWKRKEARAGRPCPRHCEICNKEFSQERKRSFDRPAFDHCHKTGKFRGWICVRCNYVLGRALDNATVLRKMADYLESFQ